MQIDIKNKAKKLKDELSKNYSFDISHTQALNIMAKVECDCSYHEYTKRNEKLKIIEDCYRNDAKEYNKRLYDLFEKSDKSNLYEYFISYKEYANKLLDYYIVQNNIKVSLAINKDDEIPTLELEETSVYFYERKDNERILHTKKVNDDIVDGPKFDGIFKENNSVKFKNIEKLIEEVLKYYSVYKLDINVYKQDSNDTSIEIIKNIEKLKLFDREFTIGNSYTFKNLENNKSVKIFYSFLGVHTIDMTNYLHLCKENESNYNPIEINGVAFSFDKYEIEKLKSQINPLTNILDVRIFEDESHKDFTIKESIQNLTSINELEHLFFDAFCRFDSFQYEFHDELFMKCLGSDYDETFFHNITADLNRAVYMFRKFFLNVSEFDFNIFFSDMLQETIMMSEDRFIELIENNKEIVGTQVHSDYLKCIENYHEDLIAYDELMEDGLDSTDEDEIASYEDAMFFRHALRAIIQTAIKDISLLPMQNGYNEVDYTYFAYLKAKDKDEVFLA